LNEVLRFATRDPSSGEWTNEMADMGAGSSPSAGFFSSIALDSSDSPVIAHYDKATGQLRVAHYSGGAFTSEVVDEGEPFEPDTGAAEAADADVGQYASLVIENDIEYIGYYDAANGDLKLAIGTAGDYEIETVYSEGNVGAWPDILIDGGSLTIAFQDVENQNLLLATGTSGNFSTTIVDDAEYVGPDSDLFMNGNALSIAYFDGQNNDMLLATKSGSDWTIDTVVGSEGALGFHNETISIGGVVYAGCYDYTERTLWFSALE